MTTSDWRIRAACRGLDVNIFFPGVGPGGGSGNQSAHDTRLAKSICAGCIVRKECLDYALGFSEHYLLGIWGGKSEKERRILRRDRHEKDLLCSVLDYAQEKGFGADRSQGMGRFTYTLE